jgi:hypothetical protein
MEIHLDRKLVGQARVPGDRYQQERHPQGRAEPCLHFEARVESALPGETEATERVTGVYLPSYAAVSLTWNMGK